MARPAHLMLLSTLGLALARTARPVCSPPSSGWDLVSPHVTHPHSYLIMSFFLIFDNLMGTQWSLVVLTMLRVGYILWGGG